MVTTPLQHVDCCKTFAVLLPVKDKVSQ